MGKMHASREDLHRGYVVEGKSLRVLAAEYGCSDKTVELHLHKHGIKLRSYTEANRLHWQKKAVQIEDDVLLLYDAGESVAVITRALHVGRKQVTRVLKDNAVAVELRPARYWRGKSRTQRSADRRAEVVRRVTQGASTSDIARDLGVSPSTVHHYLRAAGQQRSLSRVKRVAFAAAKGLTVAQLENEVVHRYGSGMSAREIAIALGMSKYPVLRILREAGVRRRRNTDYGVVAYWTGKRRPAPSKQTRAKMAASMRQTWAQPGRYGPWVRAVMKGLNLRPTSLERQMVALCREHGLPFHYVGDGKMFVGRMNPDFVHTDPAVKMCIEVGNTFHHGPDYEVTRKAALARHGWRAVVLRCDALDERRAVREIRAMLEGA